MKTLKERECQVSRLSERGCGMKEWLAGWRAERDKECRQEIFNKQ